MKKSSKIYIAGHREMVGASLVRQLKSQGYTNIITSTSKIALTRQSKVENFFKNQNPEYVFLAASKSGGILANSIYRAEIAYDNMMIAANIIHSAYKYGVKKLINFGSSCIYPKHAPQPIKEEYFLTKSLEPATEPFAIAKVSALKLCQYYNEQYCTNFLTVIPTNLYGPYDDFNLETAYVLPALIKKFFLARLLKSKDYKTIRKDIQRHPLGFKIASEITFKNKQSIKHTLKRLGITEYYVTIWGSGKPYREFLYVDDFTDAAVFLMKKYNHKDIGEFINIGAGKDIKIKELAELAKKIVGFEGEVRYDLSKPDGAPRKLFDISKIKSLNWEPTTSLKEGIQKTYEWYLKN